MKAFAIFLIVFTPLTIFVVKEAASMDLSQFKWKNRLLFLFAPDSQHSPFQHLQNEIGARACDVDDRDLVIFEVLEQGVSRMNATPLDLQQADAIRDRFAITPNTFALILVGRDGGLKLKRSDQVNLQNVFDLIDSMPMRQNEMHSKSHKF